MNLYEIFERQSLSELSNYYPNNKTAVTWEKDGKPLSIFNDDLWDFKAYSSDVFGNNINFNLDDFKNHPNPKLVEDLKYEFKLICYSLFNFKLTNKGYTKVSTLIGDCGHVRYFITMCLQLNLRITEVGTNTFAINQFKDDLKK